MTLRKAGFSYERIRLFFINFSRVLTDSLILSFGGAFFVGGSLKLLIETLRGYKKQGEMKFFNRLNF